MIGTRAIAPATFLACALAAAAAWAEQACTSGCEPAGTAAAACPLLPQPSRSYRIVSAVTSKCLDLDRGGADAASVLQQWTCVGFDNQEWTLNGDAASGFSLASTASRACLAAPVLGSGAARQTVCAADPPRFDIRSSSRGTFRIMPRDDAASGAESRCLGLAGAATNDNGRRAVIADCRQGDLSQLWRLEPSDGRRREASGWARPRLHFTPVRGDVADPNALIAYEGEYHLFYQLHLSPAPGEAGWGHAISTDMVAWREQPMPIRSARTTDGTMLYPFAGTVVVDPNTSGLCTGPSCLVAIHTTHARRGATVREYQSLAYSNDRGRTWQQLREPVLDLGRSMFRDPKVFWYAPGRHWSMVVSRPLDRTAEFYRSDDLRRWTLTGMFASPVSGPHIWEDPGLIEVPAEGSPAGKRWVFLVSADSAANAQEYGAVRYVVGNFDGRTFRADNPSQFDVVDFGSDFYAGIASSLPGEPPMLIGWMGSHAYSSELPTTPWRGHLSLPRRMHLKLSGGAWKLRQEPLLDGAGERRPAGPAGVLPPKAFDLSFDVRVGGEDSGIEISNGNGDVVRIGYGTRRRAVYLDRRRSGVVGFSPKYTLADEAPAPGSAEIVRLRVVYDASTLEVFIDDGAASITALVFPSCPYSNVAAYGFPLNLSVGPLAAAPRKGG